MKNNKFILLSIILLTCSISEAQITLREMSQKQEVVKPMVYDSTCFWYYPFYNNPLEIKKYIGQKIFILPYSKSYGSDDYLFFSSPKTDDVTSGTNWVVIKSDSIDGKNITILDAYSYGGFYEGWYLKLLFNERDTIYYIHDTYDKETSKIPFVLPAFIEKSKSQFIGKTFVAVGKVNQFTQYGNTYAINANTGDKVDIIYGERWTCVDVVLVDLGDEQIVRQKFYIPVLVFKNSKGEEIFINFIKYIDEIRRDGYQRMEYYYHPIRCIHIDEFVALVDFELTELQKKEKQKIEEQKIAKQRQINIQKFGEYYGNLINENKVVIGMTKEMCLYSWGQPFLKNETLTENNKTNFWRYGFNTYLIFENDYLKLINQ